MDTELKKLIKKPLLEIQSAEDGVWLFFTARNGKSGGINLPAYFDGKDICESAIREWCKEYAETQKK